MELEAAASDMYQKGEHLHNVATDGIKGLVKYGEQIQRKLEYVSKTKATLQANLRNEKAERFGKKNKELTELLKNKPEKEQGSIDRGGLNDGSSSSLDKATLRIQEHRAKKEFEFELNNQKKKQDAEAAKDKRLQEAGGMFNLGSNGMLENVTHKKRSHKEKRKKRSRRHSQHHESSSYYSSSSGSDSDSISSYDSYSSRESRSHRNKKKHSRRSRKRHHVGSHRRKTSSTNSCSRSQSSQQNDAVPDPPQQIDAAPAPPQQRYAAPAPPQQILDVLAEDNQWDTSVRP
eukprot:scaffold349_cov29-Attheya_sp.AAC.2